MRKKKKRLFKVFMYTLCLSIILSMNGFPSVAIEAKSIQLPIGEILSRGEVMFEAREKVWKNIESSHFPIFQKGKIKTGNGTGMALLSNNCQIEVGQNSILSFDRSDQLRLSQGRINFRVPSGAEIVFRIGNLVVAKPPVLQAAKTTTVVPSERGEAVGSLSLHSNGSVTVRSLKGELIILNQDRIVLAAISSKQWITIPSVMATGMATSQSRTMVAQAGEVKEKRGEQKMPGDQEWEYLGLNAVEWIEVGYAAALAGGLSYAFWPRDKTEQAPLCP